MATNYRPETPLGRQLDEIAPVTQHPVEARCHGDLHRDLTAASRVLEGTRGSP